MAKLRLLENDIKVFRALMAYYPNGATRTMIAEETDLPRSTVYDAVIRLERMEMVCSVPVGDNTPGRPKKRIWANPPYLTKQMWKRIEALRNQEGSD